VPNRASNELKAGGLMRGGFLDGFGFSGLFRALHSPAMPQQVFADKKAFDEQFPQYRDHLGLPVLRLVQLSEKKDEDPHAVEVTIGLDRMGNPEFSKRHV
jgi:hypothetical protein